MLMTTACQAQEPPAAHDPLSELIHHPVTAELITEHASIQPGGTTRVGVHFEIEEGWHIYADPPGDAGLATTVALGTVRAASLGPWQWPKPEHFVDPGDIRTNGYTGSLVVSRTLSLPSDVQELDRMVLQATAKWLACRDICIPGKAELNLTLPVTSQPPAISTHAQLFEQIQLP
jgi:thiol:disulfide interchange protein DsbD